MKKYRYTVKQTIETKEPLTEDQLNDWIGSVAPQYEILGDDHGVSCAAGDVELESEEVDK